MSSNTHGEGKGTIEKERTFSYILKTTISIASKAIKRGPFRFFYFDTHAGPGHNYESRICGSPILAIKQLEKEKVPYFCGLAESESKYREKLRRKIQAINTKIKSDFQIWSDNKELLTPEIFYKIIAQYYKENPQYAMGLIFIDPKNADIPLTQIVQIAKQYPRLDIVLNHMAVAAKRVNGSPICSNVPILNKIAEELCKKKPNGKLIRSHCWLAPIRTNPKWQQTILVWRNYKGGGFAKEAGFFNLDSLEGRRLAKTISLTIKELKDEEAQLQYNLSFDES